jgi:hypothetical protein
VVSFTHDPCRQSRPRRLVAADGTAQDWRPSRTTPGYLARKHSITIEQVRELIRRIGNDRDKLNAATAKLFENEEDRQLRRPYKKAPLGPRAGLMKSP